MNEYIQTAIKYLNTFLLQHVAIQEVDLESANWIPFGLMSAYEYYTGNLAGVKTLFVGVGDTPEEVTPQILEKHSKIFTQNGGMPVVFLFGHMPAYLFARYTRKNLNLMVGDKHLFLPDFLLVVGKDKIEKPLSKETLPPFAQLLLLYHLQKEKINGKTMRDLQKLLHVSYATVNRGVRWLVANGYVKLKGGKEKTIEFDLEGQALWEKAKKQMTTPVDFIVYASELWLREKGLVSGENALAEYTMYNGVLQKIALSREAYDSVKKDVFWDPYAEVEVEVWKYNPKLLSETDTIDRLSLYLLLRENPDDRVQIALGNMINEIKW